MPRILIDCSLIDFQNIPSGIPRVVINYLRHGARWGKRNSYEIYPVVFYGKEMILPFFMPSELAAEYARPRTSEAILRCLAQGLHNIIERFRKILFHILSAVGHLCFIEGKKLDSGINRILKAYLYIMQVVPYLIERHYKRIVPRQGDILFSPAYWHDIDPMIYRHISASGCKIVILVHDILPILYPQYYHYPWREHFTQNLLATFSYADAHFAVSQFTRDCVVDFAKAHGVPTPSVGIAINGLDDLGALDSLSLEAIPTSANLRDFLMDHPTFLMMVGSIEPKKGHGYIIEQLSILWDAGYELPLLIVGRKGWMWEMVVEAINQHPCKGSKLFWFTDMNDHDLVIAFRRARFLVFGSEAEGFGLPMIESLHFGCPVIALDTPISREVLGRFGLFYEKRETQFRELLVRMQDNAVYASHKRNIADFYWPDWEECTNQLFDQMIHRGLASSKPTRALAALQAVSQTLT